MKEGAPNEICAIQSNITDDVAIIKIISYCTSLGTSATTKKFEKTRDVNRKAIGEFIDVNEAYKRIKAFIMTKPFFMLPQDDKMNALAFILIMERSDSKQTLEDCIKEEVIEEALRKVENQESFNE